MLQRRLAAEEAVLGEEPVGRADRLAERLGVAAVVKEPARPTSNASRDMAGRLMAGFSLSRGLEPAARPGRVQNPAEVGGGAVQLTLRRARPASAPARTGPAPSKSPQPSEFITPPHRYRGVPGSAPLNNGPAPN